jgi:hypothetical protein
MTRIDKLNDNILREILGQLKPKDLAVISQVNKKYNNMVLDYNSTWREECNSYFCSNYEHNQ